VVQGNAAGLRSFAPLRAPLACWFCRVPAAKAASRRLTPLKGEKVSKAPPSVLPDISPLKGGDQQFQPSDHILLSKEERPRTS